MIPCESRLLSKSVQATITDIIDWVDNRYLFLKVLETGAKIKTPADLVSGESPLPDL